MKAHNPNYESKQTKIQSTANGFIVTTHYSSFTSKSYVAKTFEEAINILARDQGLLDIYESVKLVPTTENDDPA